MLLSSTWLAWAFVLPSVAVFVHRDVVEPSFAPAIEENDDQLVHTSDQSDVVRYAINHCKKIAFVHIQKTGGTTLLSLFGKGHTHRGNDAIPASSRMPRGLPVLESLYLGSSSVKVDAVQLRARLGADTWDKAYTVAFVRDPYDYFVSYYFFQLWEAGRQRKQESLEAERQREHDSHEAERQSKLESHKTEKQRKHESHEVKRRKKHESRETKRQMKHRSRKALSLLAAQTGLGGLGNRLLGNYTTLAFDDQRHKVGFEAMMRFIIKSKEHLSMHTQLAHVSDARGNILVQHVMKTGSVEQQQFLSCSGILKQVCPDGEALAARILGCDDKVAPSVNVAPNKSDSIQFYTPETCAMVATHFARDFDAFGFDKQRCPQRAT
eukprot:TRINITY_DN2361_c0_g2_i1.p1 TRINITY_DN2361_c0_g2~~TRINITY_DN2361_c0_g2_i1.p1  ORF type:complete len:380 (-),score=50.15 TRINITY_DN2361_c0_g2_i1:84-1223(-)